MRELVYAIMKAQQFFDNSFLKNGKIGNLIRIYGQIILDEKQKAPYLHRVTSKEFGFFHRK